jgi:hypothetical protein
MSEVVPLQIITKDTENCSKTGRSPENVTTTQEAFVESPGKPTRWLGD